MMSSKVAYLSKYVTTVDKADNDDDNKSRSQIDKHKHHRSKKSKKTRRLRLEAGTITQPDSLIAIDNDIDIAAVINTTKQRNKNSDEQAINELDENNDDDESEPVVVDVMDVVQSNDISTGTIEPHQPRGTWESEQPLHTNDNGDSNSILPSNGCRRRRRHDSDATSQSASSSPEKACPSDGIKLEPHHQRQQQQRRRHDSSSDDDDDDQKDYNRNEKPGHHNNDLDENEKYMDRITSESRIAQSHQIRRRQRHDSSSSDSDAHTTQQDQQRKKRHDSSDSSTHSDVDGRKSHHQSIHHTTSERMSSGHRAGIQTSVDFSRREVRLRHKKQEETNDFVRQHGAGGADTVYRDRESGQKLNDMQQLEQQKRDRKNQVVLTAEEQRILNTGRVQLEREEQMKHEFQKIQESQFARHRDDSELDRILKSKIHADDPMAAYAMKQKKQQQFSTSAMLPDGTDTTLPQHGRQIELRPQYKGPPPKPNRYNIPPGYRWDARDRGNGFEDKLLAKKYNLDHQKEQAYRYSSADM